MHFGALIKHHRIQKKMTQKELASGICSIPHLSKIENNSKEVNEETLKLLLQKLGVQPDEMAVREEKIGHLIAELNEKMTYYLKDEAKQCMEELRKLEDIAVFSSFLYPFELVRLRFLIYAGNLCEAKEQQEILEKQTNNFSQQQLAFFQYLKSIYLLKKGFFKKGDSILESLAAERNHGLDSGELYYHLAMAKTSLEQSVYAIHYGILALQSFAANHNFIRILHVQMLLGINYTHVRNYNEAMNCLQHAVRNAGLLNDQPIKAQIYHNLGYLQEKMGNPELALSSLHKSLSLQEKGCEHYLITLYTVGEIHYSQQDYISAKRCFLEVASIAKVLAKRKYQILATYYLLAIETPEKSFSYLETKVIPVVEECQSHMDDLKKFYKLLSNHYKKMGKVEKAVIYLEKIS
ncbi:helix-turn-helix transcriptional regulator [Bacillus sp. FJAT-27251]|uniref:helix-turn-helix domain-containing protein n=1 Tax=Bacillus sp. FJAT-27251 TaxID=1684142 RepID=UPI0006A7B161|nr:helix-turn-helix transcriptional regulator [Bacillus sp. FJAT-27251]